VSSSSVDGLVSGLSTSSMITSLMQVEAAPQTMLKTKVKAAETAVTSYLSVNKQLQSLMTAAGEVASPTAWRGVKASSSSPAVLATANNALTSTAGTLTMDVKALARAQTTTLKVTTHVDADHDGTLDTAKNPIVPNSQNKISITIGAGAAVDIDITADRSAEGIAKAINAKGLGVRAYMVNTSAGEAVLQFTGTKTGAANAFTITGLEHAATDGGGPITGANSTATDALIQVGDPLDGGYQITGAGNTFSDLMNGVTLTVTKVEDGVTVTADPDVSGIAAKVSAMVDAMNATMSEITKQTAYDPATKKGSPLTGNFMVRQISSTMLSKVSAGVANFGSVAGLGIKMLQNGQLQFNEADFTKKYNADPAKIQKAATDFATTLKDTADKQSVSVSAVVRGRKTEITSINDQIDNWDVRLALRKEALQKQYSNLETALGSLKNQSSWLSGQLSGL
jgi:flagellar hook-associated protein 2